MTQTIVNLGTGGAVLNGRNGSTTGADSNDALFLDWTGLDYVYLPGVAGNFLSVPDEAALDITGDIDIRVQVAMDDWTPAADQALLAKRQAGQYSYSFLVLTTGTLRFAASTDGSTTAFNPSSTAATGFADGSFNWVRVTRNATAGEVKFFTSSDGSSWSQLGSTVGGLSTGAMFNGSAPVEVGSFTAGGSNPAAAKIYRAQVFNGIAGTKVLDVDTSVITSGAATSLTALTGQTVTINRSTAGRKAVAVVSPVWLFGSDDYMEVADNDLIDFGAADSFTAISVIRDWGTQTATRLVVNKFATTVTTGYGLIKQNSGLRNVGTFLNDGSTTVSRFVTGSEGSLSFAGGVVDRVAQLSYSVPDSTGGGAPITTASLGSLANASSLLIGRRNDSVFSDFELLAVAVFRRALTATEISRITAYYQARLS